MISGFSAGYSTGFGISPGSVVPPDEIPPYAPAVGLWQLARQWPDGGEQAIYRPDINTVDQPGAEGSTSHANADNATIYSDQQWVNMRNYYSWGGGA
jgi:hypothetical protein